MTLTAYLKMPYRRELTFLAIAVIVHLLLLLSHDRLRRTVAVPAIERRPEPVVIELDRKIVRRPSDAALAIPMLESTERAMLEALPAKPQARPDPSKNPQTPVANTPPDVTEDATMLNYARIVRSIEDEIQSGRYSLDTAHEQRELGSFTPQELPPNWKEGTGARYLNPDGSVQERVTAASMYGEEQQWTGSDGSRQFAVDAPNGDIYCGRIPLPDNIEPFSTGLVMMRRCYRKPTFTMDPREPYTREFIDYSGESGD